MGSSHDEAPGGSARAMSRCRAIAPELGMAAGVRGGIFFCGLGFLRPEIATASVTPPARLDQGAASARSFRAACNTSRAASALMAAMPSPTIRSGQAESVAAITNPVRTIANIGDGVVARRKKRRAGKAARMRPEPHEEQRACEVHGEGPGTSQGQRQRCRRHRDSKFLPGSPQRRDRRHEQNCRERHAEARTVERAPTESHGDENINGSVFEEIDAVGEQ